MKRFIFMTTMAVGSLLFIGATEAEAQNSDRCNTTDNPLQIDITNDHEASDGLALHTCSTTLNSGMSYTFEALGICNGVPDIANGLSNCYTVFNEDVAVDLLNANTATNVPSGQGFMPPVGNYTHYFAIADSTFEMKGHFAFVDGGTAQAYDSISVSNGQLTFSSGANCRPTGNVKLSDLANFGADDLTDLVAIFDSISTLPVVCDGTATTDGTLTFEMDNVGLGSQSSYLSIDGYEWTNGSAIDEDADVNVVLLDANAAVAANADAVDSVLFVKEIPSGDDAREITDGENQFDVTFSKTNAMNIYYICKGDDTTLLGNTYTGLAALVNAGITLGQIDASNTMTNDCAIVGATLGEGAFTPDVTITTNP